MNNDTTEVHIEARDRFALTRSQLLTDYSGISAKRRGAAEATALRLRSRQFLEIMAFEASFRSLDWAGLKALLAEPVTLKSRELDPMVMAEIGRVLLLQEIEPADQRLGVAALEYGVNGLPVNVKSRRFRKLLVDHYILAHEYDTAKSALTEWRDLEREARGYLSAELLNPFFVHDGANKEAWLANFNREFEAFGLSPISLVDGQETPFDRLTTEAPAPRPGGGFDEDSSTVSAIVTTFQPGRDELLTAVRSLLHQTHRNLEVILVDDASGPDYEGVLQAAVALDNRVKLVKAETNGGTYLARNLGLSVATGVYVTGQDDDDWSHPERIAEQVAFLEKNSRLVGCRVSAIACLPNLCRVRLGYKPVSANASSLMMRRETFKKVGGFMAARKAADTELHRRAEELTGRAVEDIEKPLTIVRIEPDSLSRSEFRAGWSHPARREFKFSYSYWHTQANPEELALEGEATPRVSVPRRFRIDPSTFPARFDVVFAGDWRQYGGPQRSMLEEIRALTSEGFVVGVMQLEAPRFMTKIQKPLTPHVQELINDGTVTEVLYDDPVEVGILILRYPPILQFSIEAASQLRVAKMIILANQAPSELDGSDIRYRVEDCTINARAMFCEDVIWAPQGAQVRAAIEPYLAPGEITGFDIPGMVEPNEWYRDHSFRRSTLPVVGRHSRDNAMKWPEDPKVIESVYPTTGRFDIRILGGANIPRVALKKDVTPAAWTVYEVDALPVQVFLESLDFYVFFQHSVAVEAFGRAILEAIASGLVVILPNHYKDVFGAAAIYAEPAEVRSVVMKYHNDRTSYLEQVRTARAVVEDKFSHAAYVKLIQSLLAGARA